MTAEAEPASPEWVAKFEQHLLRGDPLAASDTLRKTGAKGWVKKAEYDLAVRALDRVRPVPVVRLDWAQRLLAHPRRVDKELAVRTLMPLARSHTRDLARAAYRLARDDDWEVRESAASLVGQLLADAFDEFMPTAREWMGGSDPRLRRAVVVGAKYAVRTRRPDRAEALLDLIEPALRDHDAYVRKNLGPFAIGDQFLRSYPEATLARLERWATHDDENVRWNVAKAFSAASAARHAERALPIPETLERDRSGFVQRAAASTLRRLRARRPDLAPQPEPVLEPAPELETAPEVEPEYTPETESAPEAEPAREPTF